MKFAANNLLNSLYDFPQYISIQSFYLSYKISIFCIACGKSPFNTFVPTLFLPDHALLSQHRHFFLFGDADADIDPDTTFSHAPAASQGFGAVPVGFSAGCPVATLRPCLLPSSAPSDDGDDGDGLSGIPHPDN